MYETGTGVSVTKETYRKITGLVREHPKRIRLLETGNRILTGGVFISYPLFLISLAFGRNKFFWRAVFVPAVSFLVVTLFRKCINAPRPYEKFGMPPVLKKDTAGNSFPSRHVFSVFIIAMTEGYCYPVLGFLLCIAGAAMGVLRVIGGVHEVRDVTVGALVGIACGIAGFYIFI